ncbi:hypothetical protein GPECTOR_1g95 [Gonium pectorale]|uniref:Guanylate cyclase domain-containing protein n=1 Tax=Gonium pectorale TaxID=33097 RepID=A0A150H4S2_GONPE|nr:hypothetical protein GPECTOR_1g95 [Gonium pectorale]|eukprot:KXZ57034.1 hypothetical protein GPECTOR_1g95 [Gonium pectorale]
MGVAALRGAGALAVAPLPGSKVVVPEWGSGTLVNCTAEICGMSANHDKLYLTSTGQEPEVLKAASAASAKCGVTELARMEAAAAAAARGARDGAFTPGAVVVNRAPYSVMYDYYAFINYELLGSVGLGQEMSLVQLNIASRMTMERNLRQAALDAIRGATLTAASSLGLAMASAKLDASAYASTPWFKWGLGHAALSLLPPQPASTNSVSDLLTNVFGRVNGAHTAASVRTAYEASIDAPEWQAPAGIGGSGGLPAGARVALFSSIGGIVFGFLLLGLLLRQRSRHRDLLGRVRAPRAGPDTTLLISDVQSSTRLWEQLPVPVMDTALKIHHDTFRLLLQKFNGYESATEGDSFILAFADPASAVAFASACQVALMLQPWPSELLTHPDGVAVLVDPQTGELAQLAGVPGCEGLRAGRPSPPPGSLASAAAALRPGHSLSGLPPHLRNSAAGAYAIGFARETSYDMSVHSAGVRHSYDSASQAAPGPTAPVSVKSLAMRPLAAVAASVGPTPTAIVAGSECAGSGLPDGNVGGAGAGSDPVAAGGAVAAVPPVQESATPLLAVSPKAQVLIQSAALIGGHGLNSASTDSWELSRLDPSSLGGGVGGGKAAAGSGSKLFVVRESSSKLPHQSGALSAAPRTMAGTSASSKLPPLSCAPTWWGAALRDVFPTLTPNDNPPAVLGSQLLKSSVVVLHSGRLGVVAYRGLRVRMGLHTGLGDPQHIAFNKVGSTFKYYGPFAETTKSAISAAPGGMVVLTEPAFTRLRNSIARRRTESLKWQREYGSVVVYGGHHVMPTPEHTAPPPAQAQGERPAAARAVRVEMSPATADPADDGADSAVVLAAPAPAEGQALFVAVHKSLVCRLALSPPLVSQRVAQLGSLAAPVGCITVAFMFVVGASTLLADLPGPASRALEQYQRLACGLLAAAGGYLVEGGDGLLLAAFGSPLAGVEWALDCLAGLKKLEWEEDLLGHWLCEEVLTVGLTSGRLDVDQQELGAGSGDADMEDKGPRGLSPSPSRRGMAREFDRLPSMARLGAMAQTKRVLERGLRIKVGLDTGRASHSLTDASGRLSYRGKVMNRASRVAGKAASGQVVCTDVVWQGCMEASQEAEVVGTAGHGGEPGSAGLVGVSLGKVLLRGITAPVELIQCMRS